ncbi:MAG: hypothetical protein AB7E70_20195 [Hyphomicrobiaceae bacterium]
MSSLDTSFDDAMAEAAARARGWTPENGWPAPEPAPAAPPPMLDLDPWEAPDVASQGFSSVTGQPFVNPAGAPPAPPVQATGPSYNLGDAPPGVGYAPSFTEGVMVPPKKSALQAALESIRGVAPEVASTVIGGVVPAAKPLIDQPVVRDQLTASNIANAVTSSLVPAVDPWLADARGWSNDAISGGLERSLQMGMGPFGPVTSLIPHKASSTLAQLAAEIVNPVPADTSPLSLGAAAADIAGYGSLLKPTARVLGGAAARGATAYADDAVRAGGGMVPDGAVSRVVGDAPTPRMGFPKDVETGAIMPNAVGGAGEVDDWEYGLRKLAEAKAQGPEAFAAEKARQAAVASGKVAETQATNAANARTRFSNTAKTQLDETRAAMEAASTSTRKEAERAIFGDVVDELPDIAGGAVGLQGAPTAAQMAAIDHFTDMTRGVIDNSSTMQRLYESVRPLTRYGSGDLADSRLAEMVARSAEFKTLLSREVGNFTPEEIDQATTLWRNSQLKRMYPNKADYTAAVKRLTENAKPAYNADRTIDSVQELARNAMLNGDISVIGQQLEASVRRGGTATMTGVLNDAVNRIAAQLHLPGMPEIYLRNDIDKVSQAIADGLQMSGGQTADIAKTGLKGKLAPIGKLLDGLTELQYGKLMGSVRLRTYEGLLQQNQILHKITGGKFGGDITDPLVRRHIAEYANTVGSTARKASNITRATAERRLMLSPSMTRSQINEVLTPLKSFRSTEDALNTFNLIASTALVLGAGKAINDQVGITEWASDPFDFGFGTITLPIKDGEGRNRVISILPQASFEKALLRSVSALSKGDMEALSDAWQRYGAGRLNIAPAAALRATGLGYSSEGKFSGVGTNDERMSPTEAIKASVPIPLTARDIMKDPSGAPFSITGQTEFPENQYASADRYAKDLFGGKFYDLDVTDQAAVNAKMAADGVPLDDWKRAGPYFGADDKVFKNLQEQEPTLKAYEDLTAFRSALNQRLSDRGLLPQDQEALRKKIETALGLTDDAIKKEKLRIIAKDPAIVDALQKLYEDGELSFPPAKYMREFVASLQSAGATP